MKAAINAVAEKRLKEHAFWLAGDAQEGRECGSLAGYRVAQYLVAHHRGLGLADPVGDGSYVQWFALQGANPKRGELKHVNWCDAGKDPDDRGRERFELGKDLLPLAFSGDGQVDGPVVFAGYGIAAPAHGYDDYAGLDVTDKLVLVLDGTPRGPEGPFAIGDATAYASARSKAETARAKGAKALLVAGTAANDPSEPPPGGDAAWPPREGTARVSLPCALLSMRAADVLFRLGGKRRAALQAAIDKAMAPASAVFPRCWAALSVAAQGPQLGMGANVCALHKATAEDAVDEYVVIGAHRDHVGYGNFGSKGKKGEIHNGADDNASGTSGLLELARVLSEKKLALRRHVLIIHFDGEEKGLLGSEHYASAPLVPMEKTVAMLNMDMTGRNATNQMQCGPEEDDRNPALQQILVKISARFGIALPGEGMKQYMNRSDQWPFMRKGVPAIFLFGGMHGDYHTHNDDPEKLNYTKMANIAKLTLLFAVEVAALEKRP